MGVIDDLEDFDRFNEDNFINQNNNKKENKSNKNKSGKKKDKKQKHKGLFGKLFSKKEKPIEVPDDLEDIVREEEPVKEDVEVDTVNNQAEIQHPLADTQDKQVKPIITQEEGKALEIKKNIKQNVFLYSETSIWSQINTILSGFEGFKCFGTSDLTGLSETYVKNNAPENIILFLMRQEEVEYISNFLNSLNLQGLQKGQVNIYIAKEESVKNISTIHSVPKIASFCKLYKISADKLTKGVIEQIASVVVNKQPIYKEEVKKVQQPKQLKRTDRGQGIDISDIQVQIQDALGSIIPQDLTSIRTKISGVMDAKSGLNEVISENDSIKTLVGLEEEVTRLLNKAKATGNSSSKEITNLIQNKLFISSTETYAVKTLLEKLIGNAEANIDAQRRVLESIDPEELDKIKEMNLDLETLMEKRNAFKESIVEPYEQYKEQSKFIRKCLALQDAQCAKVDSQCKLLIENKDLSNPAVKQNAMELIKVVRGIRGELQVKQQQTVEALTSAYNLANNLLRNQDALIKFDDSIFTVVTAINQEQERIIEDKKKLVVKVDSKFKQRCTLIYKYPGAGLRGIFKHMLDANDLVISLLKQEPEKSNRDFLNVGKNIISLKEFLDNSNLEAYTGLEEIVEVQGILNNLDVQSLVTRLDYLSSHFSNIFIVIDNSVDDVSVNELELRKNVARVIYWTDLNEEKLINFNKLQSIVRTNDNVLVQKVIFNKVTKEQMNEIDRYLVLAGLNNNSVPNIPIGYAKVLTKDCELSDKNKLAFRKIKDRIGG